MDAGAVTIRAAAASDVAALSQLARRTWANAFGGSVAPEDAAAELELTRSEAYFERALQSVTLLVAEEDGALVGYVQFGEVDIAGVEKRDGDRELHRLYVETERQGGGLGRRLLEAALRHPELAGASRILLQVWERNERAIRLYESVGFRTIGTTRFAIGAGEVVEDIVMARARRSRTSRPAP